MLWDISLHIADGRDEGPLANVAHYFILAGLFGVFASGFLSMCLPLEKPSRVAVKVAPGWYAPLGGVLIAAAGTFALIGFPLDDVWHRLFGQDVTLWGPTHLMLIGGAAMTLIGLAVLFVEAGGGERRARRRRGSVRCARVSLPGALLLGLSTFQAEFDFGVPQFRMVFQPMLIMLAAGVALVATRIWLGRGAALGAALFFLAMRGLMAVIVGPVLGEPTPYFPLFLVSALLVELVALRVKRAAAAGAGLRRAARHRRARRRVGLDARLHAAAVARGAAAGRADRRAGDGRRRVVRRRLARRAARHRPHAVAARRGGGRRGGDLRAHRLRPALERRRRACAGR